jgi:AraC-like DNA-binding protein
MISLENIKSNNGYFKMDKLKYISIYPDKMLQPYIAKYFISSPNAQIMPNEYTILPNASSTLALTVDNGRIDGYLYGVNTKALKVGEQINKKDLIFLIEFHVGGLYPFMHIDQTELVNSIYPLDILDKDLMETLKSELEKSQQIKTLIEAIDKLFITKLLNSRNVFNFSPIIKNIIRQHGAINLPDLAFPYYYSVRQSRRLFLRHVGINPNKLIRIVRANYALRLIKNEKRSFLDVTEKAGYYDQSHFIPEFKIIHGITPLEYKQNMSVFYNDNTRM